MADFVQWSGGPPPEELRDKRVVVRFRSGLEFDTIFPSIEGLDWAHVGNVTDIVAYRVVEESTDQTLLRDTYWSGGTT